MIIAKKPFFDNEDFRELFEAVLEVYQGSEAAVKLANICWKRI